MKTSDLDYNFPKELVAQHPLKDRDASRLMVIDRASGSVSHRMMTDLPNILTEGDLLIMNDSKVLNARLFARRETGGEHEVLLIKPMDSNKFPRRWKAMITHSKRIRPTTKLIFSDELIATCVERAGDGFVIEFNTDGDALKKLIGALGRVPLPPYIKRIPDREDSHRYQTIYARDFGSAAAPTAGLHFSEALMGQLKAKSIEIAFVTLHVGADTFLPVRAANIEEHEIHGERVSVCKEVADKINHAKPEGRRIIAVGTTSVRAIESCWKKDGGAAPFDGETKLFILPGHKFKLVDVMITNFHRPKSTLLALVSAFAGRDFVLKAYAEAIDKKYRLFSYGDAMLIN